jgi:uncharacterized membrane protein YqjE
MIPDGEKATDKNGANGAADAATGPAREMSLHLLRMIETRLEAAGIVFQAESRRLLTRLQLQVIGGALGFIAIWGGIVLLAIGLPEHLRVPVLAVVVGAFVLGAAWAFIKASRMVAEKGVGSMHWFLEALKSDLEVLERSLQETPEVTPEQPAGKSQPESTQ